MMIRLCAAALPVFMLAPLARADDTAPTPRVQLLPTKLRPALPAWAGSGGDEPDSLLPPDPTDTTTAPMPPEEPGPPPRTGLTIATAALWAGGAASIVTGVIFLAKRDQTTSDFQARSTYTKAELDTAKSTASTQSTVGNLTLFGGTLLAVGALACTVVLVF